MREPQKICLPEQLVRVTDDSEWYHPPTGGEAELQSLIAHTNHVKETSYEFSEEAKLAVCENYPRVKPYIDIDSDPVWECLLQHVKRDSSPGYPLAIKFQLNSQWMDDPIAVRGVVELAKLRLKRLASWDTTNLECKVRSNRLFILEENLADPSRLMVKRQPHPIKKLATNRHRIVNSVSVVDFLVELFLFARQDDCEIQSWRDLPSKPGMGLTDEDFDSLKQYVAGKQLNVGSDVSKWDWSVTLGLLKAEADMRIRLAVDAPEWWCRAVRNVYLVSAARVFILSDGRLYVNKVLGSMASGRKVTASSNSRMRLLLNVQFNMERGHPYGAMTMGDDCVERIQDAAGYAAFMQNLGIELTDVERISPEKFSFCSQDVIDGKPIPCDPKRMIINYVENPTLESFDSLMTNLRHHPRKQQIVDALGALGLGPKVYDE